MTKPLLSAWMIARDEEQNIGRALASIRPLVDEIVVLDTGSKDRTMQIAREFGARVFEEPWRYDFAYARNACLDRVTARWGLLVDADDEVVCPDSAALRDFFATMDERFVVSTARVICRFTNEQGEEWHTTMDQCRALRMSAGIRYKDPIHATPDYEGNALLMPATFIHHGYLEHNAQTRRAERGIEICSRAMELHDHPRTTHIVDSLHRFHLQLQNWSVVLSLVHELLDGWGDPVEALKGSSGPAARQLRRQLRNAVVNGTIAAFHRQDHPSMIRCVQAAAPLGEEPSALWAQTLYMVLRYRNAINVSPLSNDDAIGRTEGPSVLIQLLEGAIADAQRLLSGQQEPA